MTFDLIRNNKDLKPQNERIRHINDCLKWKELMQVGLNSLSPNA